MAYASVASLRLPMAMIRFYPAQRESAGGVVGVGMGAWVVVALVSTLVLLAAGDGLALRVFNAAGMESLLVLAAVAGLCTILYEFVCVTLRAESRFGLISILDAGERVVFLAACGLLIGLGHCSIQVILGVLALTTTLKTLFACRAALKGVVWRWPSRRLAVDMLSFSLPFLPHLAGLWVMERAGFFFIKHALDEEAVGLFGVAFTLAALFTAVVLPIQNVLYPMVRRAFDAGRAEEVKDLLQTGVRFVLLVAGAGTVTLCLGTSHLFSLLSIRSAAPGVVLLLVMCLAFTVRALRQIVINLVHVHRKTVHLVWISPLGAAASVLFYAFSLRSLGIVGAGVGLLIGGAVQLAAIASCFPLGELPFPAARSLFAIALSAAAAGIIQWGAGALGDWPYVCGLLVSGAAYAAVFYLAGGVTPAEKAGLRKVLTARFARRSQGR